MFISIDGEIDTSFLIKSLLKEQKFIYLPVINPKCKKKLLFVKYNSFSSLRKNSMNFFEPKINKLNTISKSDLDIIFIPLVCFDKDGNRLGMGKGFYDRTLYDWKLHKFKRIGISYTFQYMEHLSKKKWDVPLSAVITPTKIWKW